MRKSLMTTVVLFFIVALFTINATSNPSFKGNSFNNIKKVTFYKQNDKGVLEYIEGDLSQPVAQSEEVNTSYNFFQNNKTAFKLVNPKEELSVQKIEHDNLGMTHIRFQQYYQKIKVIGGEMKTHFNAKGILNTVNGHYEADINIDPLPSITSTEGIELAQKDLQSFFGTGNPNKPELVIFPWEEKYYLCWRVFLFSQTPMGRWEYLVDAKTGEIIYKANRIMNANDIGIGIGVMGNVYDHIDTDYDSTLHKYRMIDKARRANNNPHGHNGQMGSSNAIRAYVAGASLPGIVASDSDNVWTNISQASTVDGQVYTELYYDWLLSQFNRNSYDNNGSSMNVSVDYSAEGDNNAYWNGSRIVIWSWSAGWRSLAGCPDVIGHEWGHAVTENCSNLVYEKEPGALNESFSDMMGAAFEFAHPEYDTPDWLMGENGTTSGNGFRSMSNPHAYGDPDTYGSSDPYWVDVDNCTPTYYNDYCGVHTNSSVGNKWFQLLSDGGVHNGVTVVGIGVGNAIQVAYRANAFYWNSYSDYHDAAMGTISASNDLDSTLAWTVQVSNAWKAVGVDAPNPELMFTADTTWGWSPLMVNFTGTSILPVDTWTWDFGDGDSSAFQSPNHTYQGPGVYNVSLEINSQGDIRRIEQTNYVIVIADTISADTVEGSPDSVVEITISGANTIPLNYIIIPFEYPGNLALTYDTFTTVGCRTNTFDVKEMVHYDPFNKRFTFRLKNTSGNSNLDLSPGSGALLKIFMKISPSATPEQSDAIILDGYDTYLPTFTGSLLSYNTATTNSMITVKNCIIRGDVNGDGKIDASDLLYMISYFFQNGSPPQPLESGDLDCSQNVNSTDLNYFINYIFSNGPEPCGC
ncbi:MAG: PKD domain-containing protein [FCB group bacterium]|nr:PKD domain-containing protein [FCB group bacterium]